MGPSVQFGAANLKVDQSELSRFVNQSRRYRRYKGEFLALKELAGNSADKIKAMSDNTSIDVYGMPVYRQDHYANYAGSRQLVGMRLAATVSTNDVELGNVVTHTIQRQTLEPLRTFWWRVLREAQKIDNMLPKPSKPKELPAPPMDRVHLPPAGSKSPLPPPPVGSKPSPSPAAVPETDSIWRYLGPEAAEDGDAINWDED